MKSRLVVLLGCFLGLTCTKDESEPRPYPRVLTNSVTDISEKGAVFHGTITFTPTDIKDHGFLWSESQQPNFGNSEAISLGSFQGTGSFQTQILHGLAPKKEYFVRAYAKSPNYTVLGDVVTFLSLGSEAPQVLSFTPSTGSLGDTILIRGKNFGGTPSLVVAFDTVVATIISSSDSVVRATVPRNLLALSSQLSVSVAGNKGVASTPFTLVPPQLLSVDKTQLGLCDTLTILTAHLPSDIGNIHVFFNNSAGTVVSLKSGKLKVKVPLISSSNCLLKVVYGAYQLNYGSSLTALQSTVLSLSLPQVGMLDTLKVSMSYVPKCLSVTIDNVIIHPVEVADTYFKVIIPVSANITYNFSVLAGQNTIYQSQLPRVVVVDKITPLVASFDDIITITGRGFYPDASKSLVWLANVIDYQIISETSTLIKVAVPRNVTPNSDGSVGVQVASAGMSSNYDHRFSIKAPKITSITPNPITNYSTVTVTGSNFNPDMNYNNLYFDSIGTSPMVPVSASPTQLVFTATNSSLSSASYDYEVDFTHSFNSTPALMVSGRSIAANSQVSVSYNGPYTQLAIPTPFAGRYQASAFSIGTKLFFGLGLDQSYKFMSDFWEYDIPSETWTQLSDFPGETRNGAATWVTNGYGFIALGNAPSGAPNDVWRFDPASKTWQQMNDFPISPQYLPMVAVVNGETFLGFQGSSRQFWHYNFASDTWNQLNDRPANIMQICNTNKFVYGQVSPYAGGQIYKYDPASDSWTTTPFTSLTYLFGANGLLYTASNSQGIQIDPEQGTVTNFRWINFNNYFENNGKIYFLGYNTFYRLDASLYPLQP